MAAFISIEGTDGSGKTTLMKALKSVLQDKPVLFTREPGGTDFGNATRDILLHGQKIDPISEVYLFAATRRQHVVEIIKPALHKNVSVISDRFLDSSIAYQGAGRGVGEKLVEDINRSAVEGLEPDLTIFLDIEPQKGLDRVRNIRTDEVNRLDNEALDFYERVKGGYDRIIEKTPNRFLVIDASQTEELIQRQALSAIMNLI